MPVVLISTYAESGQVNLGPYSLVFPHYTTGKDEWSILLVTRGTSNTSANIQRTKVCSINFIPHKRKYMKYCTMLGFPGDKTEDKMKLNRFTLMASKQTAKEPNGEPFSGKEVYYPDYIDESIQVFQCIWDDSKPLRHNKDLVESHFVLRVDNILMQKKWKSKLMNGKGFPSLPINYGFRDNCRFWFASHNRPYALPIPKGKGNSFEVVKYACDRCDPNVRWEDEAVKKILKVPSIFLKTVISGCVKAAREEGLEVITPDFMDRIRNKRTKEKS